MINSFLTRRILDLAKNKEFERRPFFFIYSSVDIENKINKIKSAKSSSALSSDFSLYYAMKANPCPNILKFMKNMPLIRGVEIASQGEYRKALEYFNPNEILFTGPGKTEYELSEVLRGGLRLINLESLTEAHRINYIVNSLNRKPVDVLLRINPDCQIEGGVQSFTGHSTKLGVDQKDIEEAIREISKLSNLHLKGYHVFSASGVLESNDLLKYVGYVFNMIQGIEEDIGKKSPIIDLGGGFGIDYKNKGRVFDVDNFFYGLENLIQKHSFQKKELILELGRYLVAESGHYVTEIIDIKNSKNKKQIVTAGGINHNRLPIEFEFTIPLTVLNRGKPKFYKKQESVRDEIVDIGGQLCSTEDQFAKNVYVERADIGDLITIPLAGAYAYSFSANNFLSHPYPPEYFIERGERDVK